MADVENQAQEGEPNIDTNRREKLFKFITYICCKQKQWSSIANTDNLENLKFIQNQDLEPCTQNNQTTVSQNCLQQEFDLRSGLVLI